MLKIATWNVNGVRAREANICRWLDANAPDLLVLQEIKCEAPSFPASFAERGWHSAIVGQKGFNGVAALARVPLDIRLTRLPGLPDSDAQARYLEVAFAGLRVGNLYLPNGNSNGEAGYAYKLNWMDCLAAHAASLLDQDEPLMLLGDYNVCPEDIDFTPGVLPSDDALVRPETRSRYWSMIWSGLTDAVRAVQPEGACYTFWDYQAGCWAKNRGLRIDHALLSASVAERLVSAIPDKQARAEDTPSDHVPLVVTLA